MEYKGQIPASGFSMCTMSENMVIIPISVKMPVHRLWTFVIL